MKRSLYSGRDGEPDMPSTPGVESSSPEGASTQEPLQPSAWAPPQNDVSSAAPTLSQAPETLLPDSAGQANVAPSSVGQQNWEEKIFSLPHVGRAPILCARAAAAAFRLRRRPSAASVKASAHVTAATNYEQEVGLSQGGRCMSAICYTSTNMSRSTKTTNSRNEDFSATIQPITVSIFWRQRCRLTQQEE